MSIKLPQKIKLANLPTPIEKLERLSAEWGGPEIYVKRDDLTGAALSGNKIRKLEFVIADTKAKGANLLITCGGIQSNHARATAIAATKLGMKSFLVLRGEESKIKDGNVLLDLLVGTRIKYITPEQYATRVGEIMAHLADDLREEGFNPYIIPEGASDEIGTLGYVAATEEISQQLTDLKLDIDYVVCAVGSGGTHAGLLLGQKLFDQKYQVVGFNVCDDEEFFVNKIHKIGNEAIQRYNLPTELNRDEIKIIDGYVGEGYALNRPEEIDFIKEVASKEGLILDPVYTGKAMFGMMDQIKKGNHKKGERLLFIHTGGLFGLFPKKKLFY
ncbi:D-cysteine desulfhydrase family protein [candidate division KSB1 bacterium]|nr:D-cysteine desulfhydrase family protein [candidate division KSB1 bacterium]MBL7093733.1 D-cysteine desulfhydrase family protein [candidate division KSB1 bacterium]